MSQDIPQWARTRAKALAEAEASCDLGNGQNLLALSCYQAALARLIAAHEKPPVDPLIEAIKAHRTGSPGKLSNDEYAARLVAELAKRGLTLAKLEPQP